ncbi:MAG TPA: CBS domain-containing protein, partial [Thermoanaerobaculia bacterium]
VRDLTLTFHSRFLFLRHSLWSEHTVPLWDPYVANGQPVVNDALYQLFHLPSLLLRLLLPENIAFNTWVALPVPLCAAGAYLYLRRYVSPPAAAFGAVAFAGAGPIVSTTNFPNLSWSIAAVPFVFWAADRVIERRTPGSSTLLALIVSCQALAGEPVSRFMHPDPVTVPRAISVLELVQSYIYRYHFKMFPVVDDAGRLLGCVTSRQVRALPRDEWERQTVGALAERCSPENTIQAGTDAMEALSRMSRTGISRLMVVDGDRLLGILSLKDLLRFFSLKMELEETR